MRKKEDYVLCVRRAEGPMARHVSKGAQPSNVKGRSTVPLSLSLEFQRK